MKLILGCLLVLSGLALAAAEMVPEARTLLAGAIEQAIGRPEPGNRQIVEQASGYGAASVKPPSASQAQPVVAASPAVALVRQTPESSEPNAQEGTGPAEAIEIMRENERRQTALDQLKRLLAQRAVLVAERDGSSQVVPQRLIDLAGERDAQRFVAAQSSARGAANAETQAQDAAIAAAIEGAKRELSALRERIAQIDAHKEIRSDRLKLLQTASKGVIAGNTISDAKSEIANIEERRQDALVLVAQTEQRLAQAELERSKLARHARADLERELLSIDAKITQAELTLATSHGILTTMQNGLGTSTPPAIAPASQKPARRLDL